MSHDDCKALRHATVVHACHRIARPNNAAQVTPQAVKAVQNAGHSSSPRTKMAANTLPYEILKYDESTSKAPIKVLQNLTVLCAA